MMGMSAANYARTQDNYNSFVVSTLRGVGLGGPNDSELTAVVNSLYGYHLIKYELIFPIHIFL